MLPFFALFLGILLKLISTGSGNPAFVKFLGDFSNMFVRTCLLINSFNIVLIISSIIAVIYFKFEGLQYSKQDWFMWLTLIISLFCFSLCSHLYKKHTKALSRRLYEEQLDIKHYNLKFIERQHQLTMIHTFEFNQYLAKFLYTTSILSLIQFILTVVAVSQWTSTTNYLTVFASGLMTFVAMGFPFAYNIIAKLSYLSLLRSNEAELKIIGKPIAFTGVGEHQKNVVAPRYYLIFQETISSSRHANYVLQSINIIDHSTNKYEYSIVKFDYLSEIKKNIRSETDYQTLAAALRKNGFIIN